MMQGSFGLVLIVVFLTCLLTGTAIGQIYTYFTQYPNDRRWMKGMVGTLVLLDFTSTFFATAWMFNVLILDAHNADILDATSNWLLGLNPLFCGLTGFIVHCFFTWRIYLITRSKILSGFIMLGGTCAGTGALSTSVTAIIRIPVEQFQRLPFGPMWLVGTALTDAVISGSLSYHLRKKRGDFQGTNHVLDKLVRMTVQNGLLTAAVAIADLALFLSFKSPLHTVSFLMPKLYVNTVLSSLNARQAEKENNSWALSTLEHGPTASTIPRSSRPQTMSRASMMSALPPRFNVNVAVTEESEIELDDSEDLYAAGQHAHGRGGHISLQTDATGVMKPAWNKDVKNYLH